jgi:hypothetical protein
MGSGILVFLNFTKYKNSPISFQTRYFGPKVQYNFKKTDIHQYLTHYEDCRFQSDPHDLFISGEMENKYRMDCWLMVFQSKT